MAGAGGQTKQQNLTNQTSTTQLPGWVSDAGKQNYEQAVQDSALPYSNYGMTGGEQVAPLTDAQRQAIGLAQSTAGSTLPLYNQAASGYQGLMSYNPTNVSASTVTPGSFTGSDLTGYMNPYIQDVINTTGAQMDQDTAKSIAGAGADAAKYGALGGSAQGVQSGVIRSQADMNKATMGANLRNTGFNTASGLLEQDLSRNLSADQSNQAANLTAQTTNASNANTAAQLRAAGAAGLLSTAGGIQGANTQDIGNLLTTGGIDQQTKQALDSLLTQEYGQQQQWPMQMLGLRESALGMTPYNTSTNTTGVTDATKSSTPDYALSGLGALNMFKGMGGLGGLAGLFSLSEDKDKTDIQKLGKGGDGIDLYAYRYKDDPKTYPKVVGPMASGIEKANPLAVKRVGKHRVIDMSRMVA